jgi:hypothetical protein
VFYTLVTHFQISVDEFFYPKVKSAKSTIRRQLDNTLDGFNDNDLIIMKATAKGIVQSKEAGE